MCWVSIRNCNYSIPAVDLFRCSTTQRRYKSYCKEISLVRRLSDAILRWCGGRRKGLRFDRFGFRELFTGWRRRCFLLGTAFCFCIFRNFKDDLEAEVLLDSPVEWLLVA